MVVVVVIVLVVLAAATAALKQQPPKAVVAQVVGTTAYPGKLEIYAEKGKLYLATLSPSGPTQPTHHRHPQARTPI